MRKKTELKEETNPSVYNKLIRYQLKCSLCPPNKGENAKRKAKHGVKKSKTK